MNELLNVLTIIFACVASLSAGFFAGIIALYYSIRKLCPAAILLIDRVTLGLVDEEECELTQEELAAIAEDDPVPVNAKLEVI